MPVIFPSTIIGDSEGNVNPETFANGNSSSVSKILSYKPVRIEGSVSKDSNELILLFLTI